MHEADKYFHRTLGGYWDGSSERAKQKVRDVWGASPEAVPKAEHVIGTLGVEGTMTVDGMVIKTLALDLTDKTQCPS